VFCLLPSRPRAAMLKLRRLTPCRNTQKTCTTAYYRVLIRCLNERCVVWRFTAALAAGAAGIELRGWLRQASA
jgi:hypothetical protein